MILASRQACFQDRVLFLRDLRGSFLLSTCFWPDLPWQDELQSQHRHMTERKEPSTDQRSLSGRSRLSQHLFISEICNASLQALDHLLLFGELIFVISLSMQHQPATQWVASQFQTYMTDFWTSERERRTWFWRRAVALGSACAQSCKNPRPERVPQHNVKKSQDFPQRSTKNWVSQSNDFLPYIFGTPKSCATTVRDETADVTVIWFEQGGQPFSCHPLFAKCEIFHTCLFVESMPELWNLSLHSLPEVFFEASGSWERQHVPFVAAAEKKQSHAEKQRVARYGMVLEGKRSSYFLHQLMASSAKPCSLQTKRVSIMVFVLFHIHLKVDISASKWFGFTFQCPLSLFKI